MIGEDPNSVVSLREQRGRLLLQKNLQADVVLFPKGGVYVLIPKSRTHTGIFKDGPHTIILKGGHTL